jgi:hypothetical protein
MKLTGMIVAICCGLILFAGCKKSEDNTNNNNNNNSTTSATAQKIIDGKWQIVADSAFTNYMGKDTTIDYYIEMAACEKDNFFTFASNGAVTVDENANICSGKPQTRGGGTWVLLNNDTRLALVDDNPDTSDLTISSTQMKLKNTWKSSGGNLVYETLTLKNIK